jgi:hypothetical protein
MKRPTVLAALPEGETIPRILHQTYRTGELPPEIQSNIDSLKSMNPEYEYRFYDDAEMLEFIKSNYDAEIVDSFNRINPKYGAARADLFRYLLIYKCGGVYLDVKSSLRRPLREILKPADRYLLTHWKNAEGERHAGWGIHDELKSIDGGEFQQWHIVAAAGHPFLKAVIDRVLQNIDRYNPLVHGVGQDAVWKVTGPIAYSLAIAPLLRLHPHRIAENNTALGFEYSIYQGASTISHRALFSGHYSHLTESLISDITGFPALVMQAREVARRIKRALKHALKREPAQR